jgi:hypothetical protein
LAIQHINEIAVKVTSVFKWLKRNFV